MREAQMPIFSRKGEVKDSVALAVILPPRRANAL